VRFLKLVLLNIIILFNYKLIAHGFGGQTMVKLVGYRTEEWQSIKQIHDITIDYNLRAKSYDTLGNAWSSQPIKVVGSSETNCYVKIKVDQSLVNIIKCTPSQKFYEIKLQQWIPACQLRVGNYLLRDNADGRGESVQIIDIELVPKTLPVYIIEVASTHTFLVTGLSILTHNEVLIPTMLYAVSEGIFGSSLGGAAAGSTFGPVGALGGFVIGGLIAVGATCYFGDWGRTWYKLKYDVGQIAKIFKLNKDNSQSQKQKINQQLTGGPGGKPGSDKEPDEDKDQEPIITENSASHMFKNEEGHLPDTLENRKLLIETSSDSNNFLGADKYGNKWFGKILSNGKQAWTSVRGNHIRNGGLNEVPQSYNLITGLCKIRV
jgi:hypothetical protein